MALKRADEGRRRRLVQALAAGLFSAGYPAARAQLLGKTPSELPPGQSVYDFRGPVRVNGADADLSTVISSGDTIATGDKAYIIFVVGKDAFFLKENSSLLVEGAGFAARTLRLISGAALSVFGKSEHRLVLPTATVGIRGTGVYAEAGPDRSYICTCYGVTDLEANGTSEVEAIESRHHDAPRYVAADGIGRITPAPVINHTDEELMLIEALVGRRPPFALFDPTYGGPRRY